MVAVGKPPSWNEIRANAALFAAEWADVTDENKEAQTFWNEFLQIFGVDRRRVATFEQRAQRTSTGGRGRIDVWWPGTLIAEHKSAGRDLADAERQALDYLESVDPAAFPGAVITSDFGHLRILDLTVAGTPEAYEFPLRDLPTEIDRFGFIAGYRKRTFTSQQEAAATVQAARLMGRLYEQLARNGYEGHDASVLLTRLLFLLFGDDTGMWEKNLFAEYVDTRTGDDGSDLGSQLAALFQVLNRPAERRQRNTDDLLARFPYVNGGLFADPIDIPMCDREMRDELLTACAFDWGTISPAIFGSLFQAVKSREARRDLGEHYTTEKNILRLIGPLFLDELRAEFVQRYDSKIRLERLRQRLGTYRFFDPACGCGNFLVVAYRELRQLELDIMVRLRELTGDMSLTLDVTADLAVSLSQFYGIEVEEWPARIAETAMFLTDHQANLALAEQFGMAPERLPIEVTACIVNANALRIDWADICPATDDVVVLSNPPFIGMAYLSDEQQADNRRVFAEVDASGLRSGRLDYVACWYAKAVRYMEGTKARAGFVSTNSITQGEQARTMVPFLHRHGFVIDFAHRTFKWTSEAPGAAVVHVVIVGFSWGGTGRPKRLFDYANIAEDPVEVTARNINFYLVDADDIAPTRRTSPLVDGLPTAHKGSQPTDGNHLTVTADDYAEVAADPRAKKYLRPYRQTTEMLYGVNRWCLWLVDADPADIAHSPVLRERLARVAETRRSSRTASVRDQAATPALFTQIRQPATRYVAMPEVSSANRDYIPACFYDPDTIAGNKLIVWPDAPLWLFGYLQSAAFTTWVKAYAGRLKSDPSISPGLTYFTFPFVTPDGGQRQRIEEAAQKVLDARNAHPETCLADLYNPLAMPPDLRAAHTSLDRVIDGLYGLRGRISEGRRLQTLIHRYQQLLNEHEAAT